MDGKLKFLEEKDVGRLSVCKVGLGCEGMSKRV